MHNVCFHGVNAIIKRIFFQTSREMDIEQVFLAKLTCILRILGLSWFGAWVWFFVFFFWRVILTADCSIAQPAPQNLRQWHPNSHTKPGLVNPGRDQSLGLPTRTAQRQLPELPKYHVENTGFSVNSLFTCSANIRMRIYIGSSTWKDKHKSIREFFNHPQLSISTSTFRGFSHSTNNQYLQGV